MIHGDFEKGFIKAEVVAYQDFHDLCEGGKSMGPIKAAGKYRQEGKTYVRLSTRLQTCRKLTQTVFRLFKTGTLSTSNSVGHQLSWMLNSRLIANCCIQMSAIRSKFARWPLA